MIRLPIEQKNFVPALIMSVALHAVFLLMLRSLASGTEPGQTQTLGSICIEAFLVSSPAAVAAKIATPSSHERREPASRPVPVAVYPKRAPAYVAQKEDHDEPVSPVVRPPTERMETGYNSENLQALTYSPSLPVPSPASGDRIGNGIASVSGTNREDSPGSAGHDGGALPPQRTGTSELGSQINIARSSKDDNAVPRYRDRDRPVYPPLARLRGYEGVVILLVEVMADGRVGLIKIRRSSGHEILDRAALETVKTWKFEPGRQKGRYVPMSVEVPVRFVLNDGSV